MSEPDRTKLPIRRARFQGVADRTLDGSVPDWNLIGHVNATPGSAERPAGADRRRRLRQSRHLRRADRDAELHPHRRGRPAVQPLPCHRAVLADAGRAADRAQQPHRRLRLDRRVRGRVPRLLGHPSAGLRAAASYPAGQRLQHRRVRQMAPDARRAAGSGRAVRPLAERLGLRLLLRLPRRRRQPVGPVPGGEPEDHRHGPGVLRQGEPVLLPGCDGRPDHRVAARGPGPGRAQAVLRLLLHRLQPRPAPRRQGVGRQVQGQVRPGLGQATGGDLRPSEGARRDTRRCRADAQGRGVPGVGRRTRRS